MITVKLFIKQLLKMSFLHARVKLGLVLLQVPDNFFTRLFITVHLK